jgi:hypothetical protein
MATRTFVFALVAAGMAAQVPRASEGTAGRLGQSTDRVVESGEFRLAVVSLLTTARVPGGVATVHACAERPSRAPTVPAGMPISAALDLVTATGGYYRWQDTDGLVEVLPAAGVPALLQTKIAHLELTDLENAVLSVGELLAHPAVARNAAALGLDRRSGEIGMSPLPRVRKPHTARPGAAKNLTMLEALDWIVRQDGSSVWSYDEYPGCGGRGEVRVGLAWRALPQIR